MTCARKAFWPRLTCWPHGSLHTIWRKSGRAQVMLLPVAPSKTAVAGRLLHQVRAACAAKSHRRSHRCQTRSWAIVIPSSTAAAHSECCRAVSRTELRQLFRCASCGMATTIMRAADLDARWLRTLLRRSKRPASRDGDQFWARLVTLTGEPSTKPTCGKPDFEITSMPPGRRCAPQWHAVWADSADGDDVCWRAPIEVVKLALFATSSTLVEPDAARPTMPIWSSFPAFRSPATSLSLAAASVGQGEASDRLLWRRSRSPCGHVALAGRRIALLLPHVAGFGIRRRTPRRSRDACSSKPMKSNHGLLPLATIECQNPATLEKTRRGAVAIPADVKARVERARQPRLPGARRRLLSAAVLWMLPITSSRTKRTSAGSAPVDSGKTMADAAMGEISRLRKRSTTRWSTARRI